MEPSLEMMKATRFWPDKEFWRDRVVFFETSEDVPPPPHVKRWLRNYGMQGVFESAAGLLFGRPRGYSSEQKAELNRVINEVAREFGRVDLPILANLDFGDTDPQWVLPLGVKAELDCEQRSVRLIEPALQ